MYSYIIGKITERGSNIITVENGGIGYELFVSSFAMKNLENIEGEIKVYTYYQQRDDGVSLFGFYSAEEKDLFLKLISVSGVGPKGAITILSNISTSDLCVVIASQDVKALSSVKGIGKKTAERLIIELKDKVSAVGDITCKLQVENSREIDDACEVLVSLGLIKSEALRLAQSVCDEGDTAEDIITKALSGIRK